jgi:hypothetical protein
MTREQLIQAQNSARVYQERYDAAFQPWGFRAKAPVIGEDVGDYRRDLAVQAKKQLPEDHELRAVQFRALPASAFEALEPQLLKDCRDAAYRRDSVPAGQFREIVKVDPRNGYTEHQFIGPRSFVWDMTRVRGRTTLREMQKRADILRMAK